MRRLEPAAWEQLARESGILERPLGEKAWEIPVEVDLDGEFLRWKNVPRRTVRLPERLLEQFLALADAPVKRIEAYARRWGVLWLCERHSYPFRHGLEFGMWSVPPPLPRKRQVWPLPLHCMPDETGGYLRERVDGWRFWARRAKAALDIGAQLHQGQVAAGSTWRIACARGERWSSPSTLQEAWSELELVVNDWISFMPVRPSVALRDGRPAILLGGGHLFGALAVQLALAICRTEGLGICSACGHSYIPARRPRAGQRQYCPTCRELKRPVRDAEADYRRRKREVIALRQQGVTLSAIARRLGRNVQTVRSWIRRKPRPSDRKPGT
jgi:Homeodomain-like domain